MTPISVKLKKIRDALLTTGASVYHYRRPPNLNGSIVWAERSDSGDYLYADNKLNEQIVTGSIQYWTLNEYDSVIDSIQEALNSISSIAWRLSFVDYEDDTGLIYYEWEFTVI